MLTVRPIGVVRSPFTDKVSAPRQPAAARGVSGQIELYPLAGMEHAVSDLSGCDHLWVLFWFHLAHDFRPKVLPPRSAGERRGVLATRSPHRPNPIGLSVVRLERVEGLTLHIRDVDMLDGTPVLDVKPYVAYTDCVPGARVAWLEEAARSEEVAREGAEASAGGAGAAAGGVGVAAGGAGASASAGGGAPEDPGREFDVVFEREAEEVAGLVRAELGLDLVEAIRAVLSLGPQPHPYRRIRRVDGGFRLAVKDWRARFEAEGRTIRVTGIESGYRPKQLVEGGEGGPGGARAEEGVLAVHRAVWERFAKRS